MPGRNLIKQPHLLEAFSVAERRGLCRLIRLTRGCCGQEFSIIHGRGAYGGIRRQPGHETIAIPHCKALIRQVTVDDTSEIRVQLSIDSALAALIKARETTRRNRGGIIRNAQGRMP